MYQKEAYVAQRAAQALGIGAFRVRDLTQMKKEYAGVLRVTKNYIFLLIYVIVYPPSP